MLPSMRQRLILAVAIALGSVALLAILPELRPADGSGGLSLMSAAVGPLRAIALVALACLPVLALGLVASVTGHPLSGIFVVGAALLVLAGVGGPIDPWMWRSNLPGDYRRLLLEIVIWQAGLVLMLLVIQRLRSPLRTRWPALAFSDHLGIDTHIRFPQAQALGAGLVTAVFAGAGCYLLIRSTEIGQIIGSLLVAFTLGSMIAQMIFPQSNPIGILLSPGLVAALSYGYVLANFASTERVLEAWYLRRLPGSALVLPIFYASAGLIGCTLGIGLAQAIMSSETGGEEVA